ncbi:glycosyltransferase family 2 protein [Paraferrimonas sedimenticola]|uniref:Glycosyltransferase 2-like domain-containing protein n=1 Tax=Paraferrimonas sedimenticola TaxID=375674 RepID=A0AA37RTX8_9GAMM|nr:glycosyltransferase family 2 protein [Paraferrimonas sedimenticola]GLP95565.1 hypothetical protein GCM10007895_08710 [Paraferrimonas sedimenticola]
MLKLISRTLLLPIAWVMDWWSLRQHPKPHAPAPSPLRASKPMRKARDQNILVSVVIPVYGVEKYLRACLDSLLLQPLDEKYQDKLEIILVHDASPDSSLAIMESHPQRHRFRIVNHQQNQGIAATRNTGLSEAVGEYILFFDSDDVLKPGILNQFMVQAESGEAQVVESYNHPIATDELDRLQLKSFSREQAFGGPSPLYTDFESIKTNLSGFAWGKLWHHSLWHDCEFPDGLLFEDSIISNALVYRVKSLRHLRTASAFYRSNPKSIVRQRITPKHGWHHCYSLQAGWQLYQSANSTQANTYYQQLFDELGHYLRIRTKGLTFASTQSMLAFADQLLCEVETQLNPSIGLTPKQRLQRWAIAKHRVNLWFLTAFRER